MPILAYLLIYNAGISFNEIKELFFLKKKRDENHKYYARNLVKSCRIKLIMQTYFVTEKRR